MTLLECFMIYKVCSISYPILSLQQSHGGGIIISMSDVRGIKPLEGWGMLLSHLSYWVVELRLNSRLLSVYRQWTERVWDQRERLGFGSWLCFYISCVTLVRQFTWSIWWSISDNLQLVLFIDHIPPYFSVLAPFWAGCSGLDPWFPRFHAFIIFYLHLVLVEHEF